MELEQSLQGRFTVRKLTQADQDILFTLQSGNPYYFSCTQEHPVTREEVIKDLYALPPHTEPSQKFYVGYFDPAGKLAAVMDYIEGYPNEQTVFIGFFMVDASRKRQGLGRQLVQNFLLCAQRSGFQKVRLGCIAENQESYPFWNAMGFAEQERVVTRESGRPDWNVIVMQRETASCESTSDSNSDFDV